MSAQEVKVTYEEFKVAKAYEYVDGTMIYRVKDGEKTIAKTIYVYVELGKEKELNLDPSDYLKTERRLFLSSTICCAVSEVDRNEGNFFTEIPHQPVMIISSETI